MFVGSQFLDPDGWFPNHVPNPEDKAAMIAGVRAVNSSRADLGIVVDTDVDRSAVVAGNGTPINSNRYIALMAYIALRWGHLAALTLSCKCSSASSPLGIVMRVQHCFCAAALMLLVRLRGAPIIFCCSMHAQRILKDVLYKDVSVRGFSTDCWADCWAGAANLLVCVSAPMRLPNSLKLWQQT